MREIKFRVWDITRNEMHDVVVDLHWMISNKLSGCRYCVSEIDERVLTNHEDWVDGKKDFELMQYTGLNDNNDKEIYEGDIVDVGGNYKAVVTWSDYHARFGLRYTNRFWKTKDGKPYTKTVWHNMRLATKKEVIGNIYENPELVNNV